MINWQEFSHMVRTYKPYIMSVDSNDNYVKIMEEKVKRLERRIDRDRETMDEEIKKRIHHELIHHVNK